MNYNSDFIDEAISGADDPTQIKGREVSIFPSTTTYTVGDTVITYRPSGVTVVTGGTVVLNNVSYETYVAYMGASGGLPTEVPPATEVLWQDDFTGAGTTDLSDHNANFLLIPTGTEATVSGGHLNAPTPYNTACYFYDASYSGDTYFQTTAKLDSVYHGWTFIFGNDNNTTTCGIGLKVRMMSVLKISSSPDTWKSIFVFGLNDGSSSFCQYGGGNISDTVYAYEWITSFSPAVTEKTYKVRRVGSTYTVSVDGTDICSHSHSGSTGEYFGFNLDGGYMDNIIFGRP